MRLKKVLDIAIPISIIAFLVYPIYNNIRSPLSQEDKRASSIREALKCIQKGTPEYALLQNAYNSIPESSIQELNIRERRTINSHYVAGISSLILLGRGLKAKLDKGIRIE